METTRCIGLPAQTVARCRVLVLGSMPGIASLQAAQYYAHPRNRFWPLMAALSGMDSALPYPQRLRSLHAHGLGLWDVIGQCDRRGSLDADIVRGSEVVNPLPALIRQLPRLRGIACNGGTAFAAWNRHVRPLLDSRAAELPVWSLPSTSPANAGWSLERLTAAWRPVAVALAQ